MRLGVFQTVVGGQIEVIAEGGDIVVAVRSCFSVCPTSMSLVPAMAIVCPVPSIPAVPQRESRCRWWQSPRGSRPPPDRDSYRHTDAELRPSRCLGPCFLREAKSAAANGAWLWWTVAAPYDSAATFPLRVARDLLAQVVQGMGKKLCSALTPTTTAPAPRESAGRSCCRCARRP
jgi:hypothetical protein